MGKAKKGSKNFHGKDTYQRLNFLYQAANVVLSQNELCGNLPAYYGHSLSCIAKKSVLKIEPSIKRDLCKGCGCLLKAGVTMRTRLRSGTLVCTCLHCGTIKRFPTKKGYKLWIESDEACLEVIEVPTDDVTMPSVPDKKDTFSSSPADVDSRIVCDVVDQVCSRVPDRDRPEMVN